MMLGPTAQVVHLAACGSAHCQQHALPAMGRRNWQARPGFNCARQYTGRNHVSPPRAEDAADAVRETLSGGASASALLMQSTHVLLHDSASAAVCCQLDNVHVFECTGCVNRVQKSATSRAARRRPQMWCSAATTRCRAGGNSTKRYFNFDAVSSWHFSKHLAQRS